MPTIKPRDPALGRPRVGARSVVVVMGRRPLHACMRRTYQVQGTARFPTKRERRHEDWDHTLFKCCREVSFFSSSWSPVVRLAPSPTTRRHRLDAPRLQQPCAHPHRGAHVVVCGTAHPEVVGPPGLVGVVVRVDRVLGGVVPSECPSRCPPPVASSGSPPIAVCGSADMKCSCGCSRRPRHARRPFDFCCCRCLSGARRLSVIDRTLRCRTARWRSARR